MISFNLSLPFTFPAAPQAPCPSEAMPDAVPMATEVQQHQPAVSSTREGTTGEEGGSEVGVERTVDEGGDSEATPSAGEGDMPVEALVAGGGEVPASSDDITAAPAGESHEEGE